MSLGESLLGALIHVNVRYIKVGIVGGSGYTGGELLRLLVLHPYVEIYVVTARDKVGQPVKDIFPNLRKYLNLSFATSSDAALKKCDVVFFATPHGTAMTQARALLKAGVRIIDLSADFRIKDPSMWETYYGMPHVCPELLDEAVYGLPEVNRNYISKARIIANPGCYPTAVLLGFLPLIKTDVLAETHLIADVISGYSGGGRKAEKSLIFSETSENFMAYNVPSHRHLPEIEQGLKDFTGKTHQLTFVPHHAPMIRGIHATLYARVSRDVDLQALFERIYQKEMFVDVLQTGSCPETRLVRGSNNCHISVYRLQHTENIVILSAIDNLIKGAAGQAVQNMNIMFGLVESLGLEQISTLP